MLEILIKRIRLIGYWKTLKLVFRRFYEALLQVNKIQFRQCYCCQKTSLFLKLGFNEDAIRCIRCGANNRYEMLASYIRKHFSASLVNMSIIEFDPASPLRPLLSSARSYTRSYFSTNDPIGTIRDDGTVCQDLTKLTYEKSSIDLMISSDVLEHIPDIDSVFKESKRVLKVGGIHLFSVPSRSKTKSRAIIEADKVKYIYTPEYHLDPLNPDGILVFWDFGSDLGSIYSTDALNISQYQDACFPELNLVWTAKKISE